jgi:hypothetical protein
VKYIVFIGISLIIYECFIYRAVQYFDVTNKSSSFTVECVPEELEKKTTLLLYFARYMDEHLIQVRIKSSLYNDKT